MEKNYDIYCELKGCDFGLQRLTKTVSLQEKNIRLLTLLLGTATMALIFEKMKSERLRQKIEEKNRKETDVCDD